METTFLFIFTSFMFLQRCVTSNINTMTMMTISSNVTCIERERQSLLLFKQSLTHGLNRVSTWKGAECCNWHGVGCDRRTGHVVKLDLRNPVTNARLFLDMSLFQSVLDNRLGGELKPSLLNLKHIRYLDLSMNFFLGQKIPEFIGSFKGLEYLNLSYSGFAGVIPQQLGNLSNLQYLDLSNYHVLNSHQFDYILYNEYSLLVNDDLQWVSSLSQLKHLDLSGIKIGKDIDWFHPINMLPSLLTLNLASCDINNASNIKYVNFTSLHSLDLSLNNINSTIPLWLSNLTGLTDLHLHHNQFHGQIPEFLGILNSLAFIDLCYNSFHTSVPNLFWNFSSLVHLDLSMNKFYASIPQDVKLCNLSFLDLSLNDIMGDLLNFMGNMSDCMINNSKVLNLAFNQFSGSIPNKLGDFKKLEHLDLSGNNLSGNIPMSLQKLSKLETLDVSHNSLVGILSEIHFTKLKNLTKLNLSFNSLALSVSTQWVPPFQLRQFYADSWKIGPHFPNWIQTQANLEDLYLYNSSIRDMIPEWFENFSSHIYFLDLSHNQISGKLPPFQGGYATNRVLRLQSNNFEGSLTSFPSNFYILDLSNNLLSGHVPRTSGTVNPKLAYVDLSKNRFTGSVPIHFCNVFSMGVLDLSHNKFSGSLHGCLGNLSRLKVLDISNNNLIGVVPSSLGYLKGLKLLHLHNNTLEGGLPPSLQNLTLLRTMDLGNNLLKGVIPSWIGENLSKLEILDLHSNKFTGKIPQPLCQLNKLRYLNLAHNNIIGMIPHCLGTLSGMITNEIQIEDPNFYYVVDSMTSRVIYINAQYDDNILIYIKGNQFLYTKTLKFLTSLDLSSNNIVGEIPDILMSLVRLKNLNHSNNLLKGQIPMAIGDLKELESLDLSMNNLHGQIPQSLASLKFISYLNISFNNLSGVIPTGNQLQTLNDVSIYEGNIGLCGPPLSTSCNRNESSYDHDVEHEGEDANEDSWFYFGLGVGFAVGFIGLLGSLHFIRSWRLVYFEIFENVYRGLTLTLLINLARLRRKFF